MKPLQEMPYKELLLKLRVKQLQKQNVEEDTLFNNEIKREFLIYLDGEINALIEVVTIARKRNHQNQRLEFYQFKKGDIEDYHLRQN